jgi:hypothetical protein
MRKAQRWAAYFKTRTFQGDESLRDHLVEDRNQLDLLLAVDDLDQDGQIFREPEDPEVWSTLCAPKPATP